ncbi:MULTISPECIES: hypothetical protein [Lactobacillus]|uniref:hypothetical protein n=1 Tax=Lactobacillus TaxID=1578 RepID=UPI00189E50CB|nr:MULTISPECIES: hypothetical protein [Lactobacillus]
MESQVVHTLSDLLKGNKKIYQINYLVTDKLRLIYIIDEPNVLDMKLTKSGFIDLNKLHIEIDLMKDDKIHSRYQWFDDFKDSEIRNAESYQVTQFRIRVCDIKNVSEIRG